MVVSVDDNGRIFKGLYFHNGIYHVVKITTKLIAK